MTGRPFGSTDTSKWRTIETQIRPSSLTDFQAFVATALAYGSGATTTGPVFVGEDNSGNKYNLDHAGHATANLYAEGTVDTGHGPPARHDVPERRDVLRLEHEPECALQAQQLRAGALHQLLEHVLEGLRCRRLPRSGPAGPPSYWCFGTIDPNNGNAPVDAWWIRFLSNGKATFTPCTKALDGRGDAYADLRQHAHLRHHVGAVHPADQRRHLLVADVIVSGVVKGQITVATNGNVYYGGNLTQNTPGTDVIGEEAQGTLYVPEWAPDSNRNITIYSAQFSLNGAFESSPDWGWRRRRRARHDGLLRLDGGLRHHTVHAAAATTARSSTSRASSPLATTTTIPTCSSSSRRTGRVSATPSRSSFSGRSSGRRLP